MSGRRVGSSYEIVRMLARGGMAVVYLARQPALDRVIALKRLELESDDPDLAARFVGEARLAAALDHPNVVTLFDFFEDDGVPYIAMEYVAGGSLRPLIGSLSLPQIFGVMEGVLAGLSHAESHGIAHRDLKPENVLLTRRGVAKLADFGIARTYNALTQRLTSTGTAMGTPAYMAPEQALNQPLGPYTDLYAVGVIAYELLAGHPPFEGDTSMAVLYCQVHRPPPALSSPSIPPAVRSWVARLLAKPPAERPQSAAEAWETLEEIAVAELGPYWRRRAAIVAIGAPEDADDAVTTTPSAPPEPTTAVAVEVRPQAPRRRRPLYVALGAAALLGVVSATVLLASGADDPSERAQRGPPARSATPFDFDGDGRDELVMALLHGSPRGTGTPGGVVLVHAGLRASAAWTVITESIAGVPGRPRAGDGFGSGLAGADFDRDGRADLAIGTPGKERVSVIYGTARGLLEGRTQQLTAADARLPGTPGRYGSGLVGLDLDDDGFDDLVVTAPGTRPRGGSGAVQILFGGAGGLRADHARTLRAPDRTFVGFGTRLRAGDVDGDGNLDVVAGAPSRLTLPGHLSYCPGTPRGPVRCRVLGRGSGTSSLAVADVNGDEHADIVQGDSGHAMAAAGTPVSAGEVRLWLGSRRGPRRSSITITQDTPDISGDSELGDEFGGVVEAGDVDADGYADMVIAAPRENDGAGAITVVRGGQDGFTSTGNTRFDQNSDRVPGTAAPDAEFGSTLALLNLTRDRRLDLAVAAQGEDRGDQRLMVIQGGPGVFAPDETKTSTLPDVRDQVDDAPKGGQIRLARTAGG